MLAHRGDLDASALWQYFSQVLEWVRGKFATYNKALKGMNWGLIFENYQKGVYSGNLIELGKAEINEKIVELMADDEVTCSMKGIYMYIITGDGKYLSIRQFDEKTTRSIYEKQHHMCPYCQQEGNMKEYAFKQMHADHIKPWSKGGKTVEDNCQMLCEYHNETTACTVICPNSSSESTAAIYSERRRSMFIGAITGFPFSVFKAPPF